MSIGSSGDVPASAAGSHLVQTTGADVLRAQQDAASHRRQVESERQANSAAGIAETDSEYETRERDADGRRPWEIGPPRRGLVPGEALPSSPLPANDTPEHRGQAIDVTA